MIIKDFTDNDLYKFTTMNAIQKKFPDAEVVYRFVNRGETEFPAGFADALLNEIEAMQNLFLTPESEKFMRDKCYYFDSVFFDLLKGFRFNPAEVSVIQEGGKLDVEIRGLWYRTVLWEVPLMAIISELYFRMTRQTAHEVEKRAIAKAYQLAEIGAELSEFGTRRRFSYEVQDKVVGILKEYMGTYMKGTSNMDGVLAPESPLPVVVPGVKGLHGEGGLSALPQGDALHAAVVSVAVAAQDLIRRHPKGLVPGHLFVLIGVQDDLIALRLDLETGMAQPGNIHGISSL